METFKIYHFTGEGRGFMAGVSEYIVLTEDPDFNIPENTAPGFQLEKVYEIGGDDLGRLPCDRSLYHR